MTLLLFIFLFASTYGRKLNVICGDCVSMTCSTGTKCYTLSGNDGLTINEEICASLNSCLFTNTLQYDAVHCNIDSEGS